MNTMTANPITAKRMKQNSVSVWALASVLAVLVGCEKKDPNHPELYDSSTSSSIAATSSAITESSSSSAVSAYTAVTTANPANYATDAWVGQWNGPEGTFLKIEGDKGTYQLTIKNLDGEKNYSGKTLGDRIQFERDGTTETIHVNDGKSTGMKWLEGKTNCLMIREGEAYCRD